VQATPSVMYDAVVVPPGDASAAGLARDARVLEFLRDAYRHDKPLLVLGGGRQLLRAAALPDALPNGEPDPGLIVADAPALSNALAAFKRVLARYKVYARETDPPRV
jgi:catalase